MENLQKNINSMKHAKFRSNLLVIFNLYNSILLIFSEVALFRDKTIAAYISFPFCIILSYLWMSLYFISAESCLKEYLTFEPYWQNQYDNLKEFKDKYVLGNTYTFQSIAILWNSLLGFGYTWFMIIENDHKWWIILIGVIIDLIYAFFLWMAWMCNRDLKRTAEKIDKNLKQFLLREVIKD